MTSSPSKLTTKMSSVKVFSMEEIKNWYLEEGQQKLELLRTEVINMARQILIWLAISNAKEKFGKLQYEDFWGWTQQIATLRLIAIDGIKICSSQTYIQSIMENNISSQNYFDLIQKSRLSNRLKALRKIIEPLKVWRNKRYAHLENEELESFKVCVRQTTHSTLSLVN